jgi:hypothetical protein
MRATHQQEGHQATKQPQAKSTTAKAKPAAAKPAAKPKAEATKAPQGDPAFTGADGKAVRSQTGVFRSLDGELDARGPQPGQQFEFVGLYPVTTGTQAAQAAVKAGDVDAQQKLLTVNARFASKIA